MTDEAVVSYVTEALSAGRTEAQIGRELLAKGVTMEQFNRLKDRYAGLGAYSESEEVSSTTYAVREFSEEDAAQAAQTPAAAGIYGHDIFNNGKLSFEPNINLPTPDGYVLGPGDEVVIDIWGRNEATFRQIISPEGRIMVSQVGPIYLNGLTVKKAGELVKKKFAQKYSGVEGDYPSSEINLSLGRVRTIQVHVFGEVSVPGTYKLSAFSNAFHALYVAGGISEKGSVRCVEVVRSGKKIAVLDLYDFLFQGVLNDKIKLQDGDVVRVPVYGAVAAVSGKVKRPMRYELTPGETLEALLGYAGGFESDAFRGEVTVLRQSGKEREVFNVDAASFASFSLEDGDDVSVGAGLERYSNKVEVRGSVLRPGLYDLSRSKTVKELVLHADGLLEDAFPERARLLRIKDDLTPEVVSIHIAGILDGSSPDIPLRKDDIVEIPSKHELFDLGEVTIGGYVSEPGTYSYRENMTIEDLVLEAGGLLSGASAAKVDVSRRIVDPSSTLPGEILSETFSFPIDVNLRMSESSNFVLMPYDVVQIRKSPSYRSQSNVVIEGEVAFPGMYSIHNVNERLSDLVRRSGGVTPGAYLRGAVLVRRSIEEDRMTKESADELNSEISDRVSLKIKSLGDEYRVAIDLEQALDHPGSDYDMVLREGDRLFIPTYLSTVKVSGEVLYPNTVLYRPGASMKYYINMAGGYAPKARKAKPYVVYMNGKVSASRHARIEPGCEIIIPTKADKEHMETAEALAITNSVVSMTTLIASMLRFFL